jgi:hypothetical protein
MQRKTKLENTNIFSVTSKKIISYIWILDKSKNVQNKKPRGLQLVAK